MDFVMPIGYRLFLRARDARTGAALVSGREVWFQSRSEQTNGFWNLEPVSDSFDADGWYEFRTGEHEVDLLALPDLSVFPELGTSLLTRVELDAREPLRHEFSLERGVELDVELDEGMAAWPEDHRLFLVEEELWSETHLLEGEPQAMVRGAWRRKAGSSDLSLHRWLRFDANGKAHLSGLSPGRYRFKSLPPDLTLDPESVWVDVSTPLVRVRWSRGG